MNRIIDGVYCYFHDSGNDVVDKFAKSIINKAIGSPEISPAITPSQEQNLKNEILKLKNNEILYMITYFCDNYSLFDTKPLQRILSDKALSTYHHVLLTLCDIDDCSPKILEYEKILKIRIFNDEKDYIIIKKQRKAKLKKLNKLFE